MTFKEPKTIGEIAEFVGAELIGDPSGVATGINEIHKVRKGDITFADLEKYIEKTLLSDASFIILNKEVEDRHGKTLLICDDPFQAYNKLVKRERPFDPMQKMISDDAEIPDSVIIEPNVIIGKDVVIGENSYIQAGAIIRDHVRIGSNVIIQSGAIIGSEAFYVKRYEKHMERWHTGGRVVIGDDVEIGSGCTIAKGVSGDTEIGDGTKMDCQIHVGHGAVIGKHCLFAAQVGIGGKTIIKDYVTVYGQVGIAQNLIIESNVTIFAKSGVSKSLKQGQSYFGIPAAEAKEKYKEISMLKNLIKG